MGGGGDAQPRFLYFVRLLLLQVGHKTATGQQLIMTASVGEREGAACQENSNIFALTMSDNRP